MTTSYQFSMINEAAANVCKLLITATGAFQERFSETRYQPNYITSQAFQSLQGQALQQEMANGQPTVNSQRLMANGQAKEVYHG